MPSSRSAPRSTFSKVIDQGSGVTSGRDELPQSQRGIYAWDMHLKRGLVVRRAEGLHRERVIRTSLGRGSDRRSGSPRQRMAGEQRHHIVRRISAVGDRENSAQAARIGDDEDLRPDLVPGGNNNPITGEPNRYFDVTQFTPLGSVFGTLGRNTVISLGLATVDLSVFKSFKIGSGGRLQARFETFNLFNRANFGPI